MLKTRKKLILVELNEVNFDTAESYIKGNPGRFPSLERLIAGHQIRSTSESQYAELEPWIQWVSVHSGLSYSEHGIFRLGDMVGSQVPQVFEQLERTGIRVGCISAMNAENRLSHPAYFIPDPWTKTPTDGSWWSRTLAGAVSQAVNDNAQSRIGLKSAIYLALGLLRFAQLKHYGMYWKLIRKCRRAPWRKALVLDLFLHDLHAQLFSDRKPEFSTIFVNAGAHIQHHYFFNSTPIKSASRLRNPAWYISSDADPFIEMLEVYDCIVGELHQISGAEVIVATGLSQRPYDCIKYYYRLKDHAAFLRLLGIEFEAVHPRMTRDFLIEFNSAAAAKEAHARLAALRVTMDDVPVFGEIDNRGESLFVTLSYPNEINADSGLWIDGQKLQFAPHVVFVAIKNGMHQDKGFVFFTEEVAKYAPPDQSHVKKVHSTIMRFFGADSAI